MTRRTKEIIFGIHYLILAWFIVFAYDIDLTRKFLRPIEQYLPIIILALFCIVGISALLPTRDK